MKKINFIGRSTAFFLSVILVASVAISCKENDSDVVKPKTITDVILQNSEFSILREIVLYQKLGDALRTENLTVFAPNDAAFRISGITSAQVNALPGDSAKAFVFKHILGTRYAFDQIPVGKVVGFVKTDTLTIRKSATADSIVTVNGANIITKNVNADNGVIQVVNKTLATLK